MESVRVTPVFGVPYLGASHCSPALHLSSSPFSAMTAVSPFARSSAFEEPRLQGREQTVCQSLLPLLNPTKCRLTQIEEMYSVPESFLEIEVRNPQTHGAHSSHASVLISSSPSRASHASRHRFWPQDVHRLRNCMQGKCPPVRPLAYHSQPPPASRPTSPHLNYATLSCADATLTLRPSVTSSSGNLPV